MSNVCVHTYMHAMQEKTKRTHLECPETRRVSPILPPCPCHAPSSIAGEVAEQREREREGERGRERERRETRDERRDETSSGVSQSFIQVRDTRQQRQMSVRKDSGETDDGGGVDS